MSLVNEQSPITVLAPFELFSNAPIQNSIETTKFEEIRPISQLNTGGYLEFNINSNLNEYVKLDEIYLFNKFKVNLFRRDKSPVVLDDWKKVSFANNILHSMWNQVDLSINDRPTTSSLLTYAHKAYLNTILNYDFNVRNTFLKTCGYFIDDESTHFNGLSEERQKLLHPGVKLYNSTNSTETILTATTANAKFNVSKTIELCGTLNLDLFKQFKYLLGGSKLFIKLVQNKPEFFMIIKDANLYVEIEFIDVHLEVPKCIVNDDIVTAHNRALQISYAKYPIDRFEVRSQTIDKGVFQKNVENVIHGQLPKKIFVALIDNEAFNGSYTKNPFLYKHYNLSAITCVVNSNRLEYKPNFSEYSYLKEYLGLCKTCNQSEHQNRMQISSRNFAFGYAIYGFNLSSDGSDGFNTNGYVNLPKAGIVRFELQFNVATPETLNILFFCEFDNQICITADRTPILDY